MDEQYRNFRKYMPFGPPGDTNVYWIVCHGGLGDYLWLHRKALSFGQPLFIEISIENRFRPKRSGQMVDHLPGVIGWKYSDTTFAPGGQDWTQSPDDPACALDKTWQDLALPMNTPVRLECNRHLEMGRRLEDWLPDLPTTWHFDFEPADPPTVRFRQPAVVLHIAGWPDVPDSAWIALADLFRVVAKVYIVGGSYDNRPRRVYNAVARGGGITLLEDVGWSDLVGVLENCDYVFGHASGFTVMADVLRVKGAVYNPASVPKLVGTWNSPENPGLVQVDRVVDFVAAARSAFEALESGDRSTWPPTVRRGPRVAVPEGEAADPLAVVRAAGRVGGRHYGVVILDEQTAPLGLAAAALAGAYDAGHVVNLMLLIGGDATQVSAALREGQRCSRRPHVDCSVGPWPGDHRHTDFDLVVVWTGPSLPAAAQAVRAAWGSMGYSGTLLVGGPRAAAALESLASTLKVKPAAAGNAPDWYYLHRRA